MSVAVTKLFRSTSYFNILIMVVLWRHVHENLSTTTNTNIAIWFWKLSINSVFSVNICGQPRDVRHTEVNMQALLHDSLTKMQQDISFSMDTLVRSSYSAEDLPVLIINRLMRSVKSSLGPLMDVRNQKNELEPLSTTCMCIWANQKRSNHETCIYVMYESFSLYIIYVSLY